MKLAVFTDAYLPQVNGIVTHIIESLNVLTRTCEVMLVVPKPQQPILNSALSKKINIVYLSSLPLPLYKHWRITLPHDITIYKKLDRFNPDVIHVHTPITVSANGISYAQKKDVPLVSTFHGYFMEPEYLKVIGLDKVGLHNAKWLNKLLWRYARFYYNKADVVICPSEATKQDVIAHGITKPVRVISNGINLDSFKIKTERSFTDKKYFLYVGRLSKDKSVDIVLRALHACENKSARLIIVGDGPTKLELQALVNTLDLVKRVDFLGEIPYTELIRSSVYEDAIAFITASTSETQGIAILEAMACGLPIIGVHARAIPELVKDNGFLCFPEDVECLAKSMQRLISDEPARSSFRKKSLELVQIHSVEKTALILASLYRDLIDIDKK